MNGPYDHSAAPTLDRTSMNLQAFNHLILQHQDEAYTLAVHLMGDELLAEETLEKAVAALYNGQRRLPGDFRMEILRQVTRACLQGGRIAGPRHLARILAGLSDEEKAALVLVDCLGLDYADAAAILGKTPANLATSLAQARYKMNKRSR